MFQRQEPNFRKHYKMCVHRKYEISLCSIFDVYHSPLVNETCLYFLDHVLKSNNFADVHRACAILDGQNLQPACVGRTTFSWFYRHLSFELIDRQPETATEIERTNQSSTFVTVMRAKSSLQLHRGRDNMIKVCCSLDCVQL